MSHQKQGADTRQARWARFRFSIVGPLLSAPPPKGELKEFLAILAKKQWAHPITGLPCYFSASTIERWFYQAFNTNDPVDALRTKHRSDAGQSRALSAAVKQAIQQQHRDHPGWSYQLHKDNLVVLIEQASSEWGDVPSYSTVRRYMKYNGYCKRRNVRKRFTAGAEAAAKRLEQREVRSFEVEHVHALWHLDFHHGSRKILCKDGHWYKPLLLAIIDDHSRLICHMQWYLDETAESLVHGFKQALQRRALPRALMTDNGSAMISAEFTEGLERLGILHQTTLPYSPYQNAKQEVFWAQVEGRLMAMLEGEPELTLKLLNDATFVWVEQEYHQAVHSELGESPLNRILKAPNVGRPCPDSLVLKQSFCMQSKRKQRKSDGTITVEGHRFEVPSRYRHFEKLCVRYARWDLSYVLLVDPNSERCLDTLYPQDKSANASGLRRTLEPVENGIENTPPKESVGIAPLLKKLMADYVATGLPPAYIPKGETS